MKRFALAALITGALSFSASHAFAAQPADHPVGPGAGKAAKAKAYGKYCQDQSKKHVAGVKGTPFSACVTAMAKVAKDEATTGQSAPRTACLALSKKHVKGEKGTAFSRCVVGAQELKRDLKEASDA